MVLRPSRIFRLIIQKQVIYHTAKSVIARDFLAHLIKGKTFNISVITRIEFLGWHAQTSEGFESCERLVGLASVLPITDEIADKAIDLRRHRSIKLADAIIAPTAIVNDLKLATRNPDDFKGLVDLEILNPFQ